MMVRIWRGITLKDQADAYLEHLKHTAMPALRKQSGLHEAWTLRREHGDRCEFQLITLWDSLDAMRAWTGSTAEQAVYFDQDEQYLLDMEPLVRVYEIADRLHVPVG